MFAKFNIDLNTDGGYFKTNYYTKGQEVFASMVTSIETELSKFIDDSGSIDGSKLQENWFTDIKADVFISHSHADEKLAISVAGWLYHEFGLIPFVDSCLWGYADNLLSSINDKYNIKKYEKDGIKTYYHDKANYAASHVHMMLCTSLNKMINNCECVFFLNTKNSVIPAECSEKTKSPWIYLEICLANTIQRKVPIRYELRHDFEFIREGLEHSELVVKYDINLKDFVSLNRADLREWLESSRSTSKHHLDVLYEKHGIITLKGNNSEIK